LYEDFAVKWLQEPNMLGVVRKMANENTRTIMSGILGTALGITITYMTGVSSNRTELVRLATEVKNLTESVKTEMVDRYHGTTAAKDHKVIEDKLTVLKIENKEMRAILTAHQEVDKQLAAEFRAHVVYCERNRK